MTKFLTFVICSILICSAHAGLNLQRKFMSCTGSEIQGAKATVFVSFFVLNAKQVEGMKIQFKKQVLVNELGRVSGEVYSDGIIKNHLIFKAQSDQDLGVLLPVSFRMTKKTEAFLAQQKGDDVTFVALNCSLQ